MARFIASGGILAFLVIASYAQVALARGPMVSKFPDGEAKEFQKKVCAACKSLSNASLQEYRDCILFNGKSRIELTKFLTVQGCWYITFIPDNEPNLDFTILENNTAALAVDKGSTSVSIPLDNSTTPTLLTVESTGCSKGSVSAPATLIIACVAVTVAVVTVVIILFIKKLTGKGTFTQYSGVPDPPFDKDSPGRNSNKTSL